ncbi:unnamed protein product [Mytilus coruscus]|uniref:Uncharacterized protein n=1 Tax=Mytilus coruscus TaxID=42192 RepID=A0A6J8B6W8_MYTCO|nr:unnamed protein product [Mytilus coruscus]
MDTPRVTRRNSTQTKTPDEVRSRLFTHDSGIGELPSPWASTGVRMGKGQFRPRRQNGEPTLATNEVDQRAFSMRDDGSHDEPEGNDWGRFWLWWISFLIMVFGCIAFALGKLPREQGSQISQEYAMKGLLAIIAVMVGMILVKIMWRSCKRDQSRRKGYHMPSYQKCPTTKTKTGMTLCIEDRIL